MHAFKSSLALESLFFSLSLHLLTDDKVLDMDNSMVGAQKRNSETAAELIIVCARLRRPM
jgi:hypothetical protein